MQVKTYNRSKLYNIVHTIGVALSPRVPKFKRRTLAQLQNRNVFDERQKQVMNIIKNNPR